MKSVRFVLGVVTFVLFFAVLMQYVFVGPVGAGTLDHIGGPMGLFVTFLAVLAGLIAMIGKKSATSAVVVGIIFLAGAVLGMEGGSVEGILAVWGKLFLTLTAVFWASAWCQKRQELLEK